MSENNLENYVKKNIFFVILLNLILFTLNCSGGSIHSSYVPSANTNPTREYATPSVLLKGGFIYHKTYVPGPIGLNAEGTSEGRGCSQSVLYLFSSGNSSIEAAKRAGNITKVAYLDYEQVGIFMGIIYHRFCTIVKGS
ncbi:TRL-like family protein [Leptospira wolbachii serovar Codice str. CDC]|uniref:TRL-like family protein n=1 Tax=Leptospira wolbachii serovar Codice str. CDC TaxID=1218599 RepID=R9A5K9_9LEPT|nr:TRL-like family protein [Leptospira wolbachii serovar Codice str. CDC]